MHNGFSRLWYYFSENHPIANGHGFHKYGCEGWNRSGSRHCVGIDGFAVVVQHVVFPVEDCLADERVAHQVPAPPFVGGITDQYDFAIVVVMRTGEDKGSAVVAGIQLAFSILYLIAVGKGFVILPFVVFVRRVKSIEVVRISDEAVLFGRHNRVHNG